MKKGMMHTITEHDLELNPCMRDQGIEVGMEVELGPECDSKGSLL